MMNETLTDKVVIRLAEPNDLPDIFKLVDSYADGLGVTDQETIDDKITKNSLRDMVYMQGVLIAEYNGVPIGGMGGYLFPSIFNKEQLYAVMFFYVIQKYRHLSKEVMKEIEMVLIATKATHIVLGVWGDKNYEKRSRFLRMNGYKLLETHYKKRLA